MPLAETATLETLTKEQETVNNVKEVVEFALEVINHSPDNPLFDYYKRRTGSETPVPFTTDPEKIDPSQLEKYKALIDSNCLGVCSELVKTVYDSQVEIPLQIVTAHSYDFANHIYLTLEVEGTEVIIDPTVGQYLEGHWTVFVGTREQLHDLVENHTGEGKDFKLIHTSSKDPEEAFERIWGNRSDVYAEFDPGIESSLKVRKVYKPTFTQEEKAAGKAAAERRYHQIN